MSSAGDFDGDGDVDPDDLAYFKSCVTGLGVAQGDPVRQRADFDFDGDVDLADYVLFQRQLGGTGQQPAPPGVSYDYRNRLVTFACGASPCGGSAAGTAVSFAYDALGRRIKKTVSTGGAETVVLFFYDGDRVVEERDAAGATLATYVYGRYIDAVLSMRRDVDGTPEDYYYLADDMRNVDGLADSAGNLVELYEYDDFGQPAVFGAAGNALARSAYGNRYLFTGREYDPETGLYYYRTRYYDPILGRFTTRDTIGIWGDPLNMGNPYAYVGNNPWTLVDPLGREGPPPGWQFPMPRTNAQWAPYLGAAGHEGHFFHSVMNGVGVVTGHTPFGTLLNVGHGAHHLAHGEVVEGAGLMLSPLTKLSKFVVRGADGRIIGGTLSDDAVIMLRRKGASTGNSAYAGYKVGCPGSAARLPVPNAYSLEAYEVGTADSLQARSVIGDRISVHHVGQAHLFEQAVAGHDRSMGPAIALPQREHLAVPKLRGATSLTPRQILARDIVNLRDYTKAPNNSLRDLIDLNKQMYPGAFRK